MTADHWRRHVAEHAGAVLVTSRWMLDRVAELGATAVLWEPGVDTVAFTPLLRDAWLHARWTRARSRSGQLVSVGYVGSLRKRHGVRRLAGLGACPVSGRSSSATGRSATGWPPGCPAPCSPAPLATGDLAIALASLDVLVHPGEHETCCHTLREAAPAASRRGTALGRRARRGPPPRERPALRPRPTRAAWSTRSPRWPRDPQRALLGARARELAPRRTWRDAVDELVAAALPGRAARRAPPGSGLRPTGNRGICHTPRAHTPANVGR